MQLTYEQLAEAIAKMTPEQRRRPVKMYNGSDGELHPCDDSSHPEYGFSSRLVMEKDLQEILSKDYINPNQYVIEEYMDEEGSRECQILWSQRMLLRDDLTFEQRTYHESILRSFGITDF